MAKGWFRDLLIPMKPTESTPPTTTTTSRKSVISFRETFFIPLLRLYLIFFLLFCFLFCLGYYERECMCEITLSRDDAEAQSVASLAHSHDYALKYLYTGKATEQSDVYGFGAVQLDSHDDAETPWVALPSPRHYIITSFDPPLFVLDGLLFSYYCLIGLSLYLSVQILKIFMKPTLKTLVISLKNKCIISVWSKFQSGKNRETFFIPLLRLCLIFCLLFCLGYFLPSDPRDVVLSGYLCYMVITTLKKLIYLALIYLENRGDPFKHLKRERITESLLSRDDAEAQSLAFLAHISVHMGILLLLLSLPSPRHFITSFDPPLFVLDGLLFSYYCLIGLSLHLSVQILKKIMKPMLNTLAISLKNKGIISVSSKFESGKNREQKPLVEFDSTNNREQKPLVEFDSTNNRAYRSSLLVEDFYEDFFRASTARSAEKKRRDEEKRSCLNSLFGNAVLVESDKTNAREASKGPCMTEGVPSLVDSTTRISSTDFDAPDNSAHLVRAIQSGPIMLNSEKNDTSEGLIREGLTESVLSLDDSTKRKSFPDFDAAENKAHLVRPYQSGPVVSLSKNKNEGEALKKDLQQHCGGRSDAAAKSFRAISDPGLYTTDSLTWKSFEVLETLRPREQQSNATDTDQERQIQTQMCDELSDAHGGRPDAAAKSFHAIYDPGFHTPDSIARKSFEVLETLPARKQPNDGVPLLLPGRLTLEGCVQQEKSPDLPRVMQFNGVEQRVTKMPRYLGGLTAQSASSSCGPIGLPDGGHIVLLDALDQSTKNIDHVATADQCSPTLSLPEKKMVRKTLNRNCRTMSVIFEEKHQRFVRRCEGATKSLGAMCISRKHGINQVSMMEPIHKQRGIHQSPFLRSAVGLQDGGHILSLLEEKIVRKTLKRKCRSMSVLSLKDHKQHVDRRWEDAAKIHGAKCIRRQLVIHHLSTAKHTHKKHGIHQWPFQRPAISLPDRGHILSISEKKIVRKTLKRKCRSMSVLSLVDRQQHVDRRWEDAAKNIGAKRICRQLVIHRVSIAKRICRQHGIHHRWPFERDRATEKGYSLGDEIPVEVINLSTHAELVSRLQLIYISWLGRFSPRPSAIPRGGLIAGPIALSSSEFAATNNIAQRVRQDQKGSGASGSENERTREQKDPKEKRKSITIDDLLVFQGKKTREEVAEIYCVSLSTVKRTWSKSGRGTWKNGGKNKVWRPPDQHGKGNTSTAREIPSNNVQTGMEGEPVGQNQEENECRRDFMGRQIALDTESGLITVSRPPDQHGERNTSTARETPSHNVQTGIEGVPVGQNQEANEFRPIFTEGSIPSNTENGLIKGSYFGFPPPQITSMPSEYMGGSIDLRNSLANLTFATCSDQAAPSQHVQGQSMHPTVYPSHNVFPQTQIVSSQEPFSEPLGFPPPQITLMPSENMGGSIDLRNSLASQVVSDGHISGSTNSTFATCSDQAALSQHLQGQSMHPTIYPDHNVFPQTQIVSSQEPFSDALGFPPPQITSMPNENMGGSIDLRNSLANLTFATCSDQAAPSQHVQGQSMHPTVYPDHNVFPQTHIVSSKEPFSEGRVMIKAFCRDADNTIIKFWFHLTSGIVDLKKEVSKRLNVEVDRFVVKYKDKYEDLISILCDDDLKLYLSSSLGNDEINVLVHDKVGGTPNFCEKCRSPMQTRA